MSSYLLELAYNGSGFTQIGTAGATLPARSLVYLDTNGQWQLADADTEAAMPVLGIAVGGIQSGKTGEILLWGFIASTDWSWTAGANIYASTVAGELTETLPTGAGDVVQPIAISLSSSMILFQGSVSGTASESNTLEGSTAYVGVDQTKDSFVNYFTCDGVADDVQINEAQAYAVALGGGTVEFEQGTYTLADPIIPTGNRVWFKGQGVDTLIDGDGLATGEHAFHITGRDNISITNLSIQTEGGGGKTSHCILLEDGSDNFDINNVFFADSDDAGIRIEGTSITGGRIEQCGFTGLDGSAIIVDMDAGGTISSLHISDNGIISAGGTGIRFDPATSAEFCVIDNNTILLAGADGIALNDFGEGTVTGNLCRLCTASGITLETNCDDNFITGNTLHTNGTYGVEIEDATSQGNRVTANHFHTNTTAHVLNAGTGTVF